MPAAPLFWNPSQTPKCLHSLLKTLGETYPIRAGKGKGIHLRFEADPTTGICQVECGRNTATIRYGAPAQAARGVGAVLSGLASAKKPYREITPFETLGIMFDCSRNAVMAVDHVKLWLRRMALLGYNMFMLYTEDTYELEGEPHFGHMRGAYTADELREIDDYAASLNIEVIPCIQTLGHMEQILWRKPYAKIRDTSSVMMVGEPETYKLIDKMLAHWKKVCRSKRIHIGMDETHDLGRGAYMNMKGYRPGFDLFNEHLAKVVKLCKKHKLDPMIWSDMYFRLGSKHDDYYDVDSRIPDSVVRKIPKEVDLVYWDYYHKDKEFYLEWIKRHRAMGKEPLVASGIWTWNRYWYDRRVTERTAGPCVEACTEAKVKELVFTLWGDNGAYCDHDSSFAGMVYCADKCYGNTGKDKKALEKRFGAVCGGSYAAHVLASTMHWGYKDYEPKLWDDPIFELHVRTWAKDKPKTISGLAAFYDKLATELAKVKNDRATGDLRYAAHLTRTFADRYDLLAKLLAAYRKKDKKTLRALGREIPLMIRNLRKTASSFRAMWMRCNKPEGLHVIQGRFGTLEARYKELAQRLREYLNGTTPTIAEWEHPCPPK